MTPITSERVSSRTMARCSDDMAALGHRKRSLDKRPVKKVLFSADDMALTRKDNHMSSQQTITLMEDLNKAAEHKVIGTSAKKKMHARNYRLDSHFHYLMIQFSRKIKGTKKYEQFDQHLVVVNDINSFIGEVLDARGIQKEHSLTKISMDGGGGFLKIVSSVFILMIRDESNSTSTLAKKFLNSGVKKIFIIAIAPLTWRTYGSQRDLILYRGTILIAQLHQT